MVDVIVWREDNERKGAFPNTVLSKACDDDVDDVVDSSIT